MSNATEARRSTVDSEKRIRIEIESYMAYGVSSPEKKALYSQNPLLFWKENGNSYPILQHLAALYLGMSAGSVPVESLFSISGLVCNSRRSSLCPSKLHKICFLHDNLSFVIESCDS